MEMSDMRQTKGAMRLFDKVKNIVNGARILSDWIGHGGHVVDKETAQQRADICLKCPEHTGEWSFAEPVANAIKEQLELKKHLSLRVNGEKSLHVCSVCTCVCRLKIWLPIENIALEPEEQDAYPSTCWLRNESR